MTLLEQKNVIFLIIDIQEKLLNAVYDKTIAQKAAKMAQAANILGIPIIITEQYPKGLGDTVSEIKDIVDAKYFEKTKFSAYDEIKDALKATKRKQIIICGIEGHICVHQTTDSLLANGYQVHVLKDATGSRNEFELEQGINRMEKNGATITCFEMALFEILKSSKHPDFKAIQELIK
ncbi:MAG: isochorismatase family protein [Candidatus Gastranaerophilales bacterium]|nr:isochorismatase family protein [Candidatus Gastranaerophilales bacterium]